MYKIVELHYEGMATFRAESDGTEQFWVKMARPVRMYCACCLCGRRFIPGEDRMYRPFPPNKYNKYHRICIPCVEGAKGQ